MNKYFPRLFAFILLSFILSHYANSQEVPASYVQNFFGACHMGSGEAQFADELGVKWSRKGISWSDNEPRKGQYDFSYSDELVKSVYENDANLLGILSNVPLWATTAPKETVVNPKHFPYQKSFKTAGKNM